MEASLVYPQQRSRPNTGCSANPNGSPVVDRSELDHQLEDTGMYGSPQPLWPLTVIRTGLALGPPTCIGPGLLGSSKRGWI